MIKEWKRQERLTYLDTIEIQKRLIKYVFEKMAPGGRPYHETQDEQLEFMDLVSKAFLGSGISKNTRVQPVYEVDDQRIILGYDIHHFALNIMMNIKSRNVTLVMGRIKHVIPAVELWKTFLKYASIVLPRAEAEAFHASVEHESSMATTGYKFGIENEEKS